MMEAYRAGDPYLAFGKQAGRIPADGTKRTHGPERELFKLCVAGVQYGMEAESLGRRIGKPTAYANELLQLHRETYPKFWRWSDGAISHAMLLNHLHSVFGWTIHVGVAANPRSLRNFPCQANGAECLRLACSPATERGVDVVVPIHDALLVEGPADAIDEVVARTQEAMEEASAIVLGGFQLRSDARIVRWPDRYIDERGREFWCRLTAILASNANLSTLGLRVASSDN
jgi:DNA polymerase I-like protein with 3'-5' exonuclease and polymerase domains